MKTLFALLFLFAPLSQLSVAEEKVSSEQQDLKNGKSFTLAVLPDTQFYCDTRLKLQEVGKRGFAPLLFRANPLGQGQPQAAQYRFSRS